jgi:hypothetical protein
MKAKLTTFEEKSVSVLCRVPARSAKLPFLCGIGGALIMALALANIAAADEPVFNRRATATAQVLAGITPIPGDAAIDRLIKLEAFAEHQKWMTAQWGQVMGRIAAMENWRNEEVKVAGRRKAMIYPFSGPDFVNAYTLFPDHHRYIFFSLERPGGLPDLESVTFAQFGKLLEDVRSAFRDIFQRNYFITDYMNKQLGTPWIRGTVPVITTMMALINRRIVRIEPIDLYPELTRAYDAPDAKRPRRIMRAVRIEFAGAQGGATQWLYYFSVDAADKALEFYPGFLNWLQQNGPATVLLKSASYLLHDNQFEKTREMILATADYVIQDDTGLPFRYLQQSPWQVKLYGRYNRPIKGLRYGYQADLESAYGTTRDLPQLPFPFGYHWRGQQSGLLVANR